MWSSVYRCMDTFIVRRIWLFIGLLASSIALGQKENPHNSVLPLSLYSSDISKMHADTKVFPFWIPYCSKRLEEFSSVEVYNKVGIPFPFKLIPAILCRSSFLCIFSLYINVQVKKLVISLESGVNLQGTRIINKVKQASNLTETNQHIIT